MAIAALVLGILSIVIGAWGFLMGPLSIVGFIIGVLGIIFASVSISKGKKATGGLVCSILGTVFCFIPAIVWFLAIAAMAGVH